MRCCSACSPCRCCTTWCTPRSAWVGFLLARTAAGARNFPIWGGVVYAVLWIYGLLIDQGSDANFVPVNSADNWLHLVLAVGMIALGVLLGRDLTRRRA